MTKNAAERMQWHRAAACVGLLSALLTCAPAQVVHVANNTGFPVKTWKHTTVDVCPPYSAGLVGDVRYVRGKLVGANLWSVDLWLDLAPGERFTVDLANSISQPFELGPLPEDPVFFFGGWATCNGQPMSLVEFGTDGAAYTATLRARTGSMFDARAWVRWYPDMPGFMFAETTVTASNPAVPDLFDTTPPGGITFTWGDAWRWVIGAGWMKPVVPGGTTFADGQAWSTAVVLGWVRYWTPGAVERFCSASNLSLSAVSARELYPDGNPQLPATFDATHWSFVNQSQAVAKLHTWEAPPVGPNRMSGDTGAQEDQWCVGSECLLSAGAEQTRYVAALSLAHRPCHHLDTNGRQRDPLQTPGVMFWMGRPHSATGNLLGKWRSLAADETSGWWGPDDEHWFYNTAFSAYRLTGSRALQWEIEQQARLYLFGKTLPSANPGWYTSSAGAARAIGWESLLAVRLHHCLSDRALAARVEERWKKRWSEVWDPQLGNFPGWAGWWDVRRDDRLGPGLWVMGWQEAVGAAFLDYAGEYFGVPAARARAFAHSQLVLDRSWSLVAGRWKSLAQQPIAAPLPPPDEVFNYFGMCLVPWVVLKHDPTHPVALAVWAQLTNEATEKKQFAWLPPVGQ
jgi:hypothetical protein